MKTELNLPANCSVLTDDEMMNVNGGFQLDAPKIIAGIATVAVGAIGVNLFKWFNGSSDTNFIQDSINFGQNFINGAVESGRAFLNALMGK